MTEKRSAVDLRGDAPPLVLNNYLRTIRHKKKLLVFSFFVGAIVGVTVVGSQVTGTLSISSKDFLDDFVFLAIGIVLACIAFARVTRGIYEKVASETTYEEVLFFTPTTTSKTRIEILAGYAYGISSVVASLASGAFIGGWSSLLFSGYLWVLIGAR